LKNLTADQSTKKSIVKTSVESCPNFCKLFNLDLAGKYPVVEEKRNGEFLKLCGSGGLLIGHQGVSL
jgi:hypothetical protein